MTGNISGPKSDDDSIRPYFQLDDNLKLKFSHELLLKLTTFFNYVNLIKKKKKVSNKTYYGIINFH